MEADSDSTPSDQAARRKRGTYYRAAVTIVDLPGVVKESPNDLCDIYEGEAESLVAAGLVSHDMLPGQPGRPKTTATYRATGVARQAGEFTSEVPGHLRILRLAGGRFRAALTVSREEQSRRAMQRGLPRRGDPRVPRAAGNPGRPEFEMLPWAEKWSGSKAQLQSIGIGVGLAFPGEPGGPKGTLSARDSLGFAVSIAEGVYEGDAAYIAHCAFLQGAAKPAGGGERRAFARGVTVEAWGTRHDVYSGSANDLVACGLVRPDQLPGQPGRGTVRCSYTPDGNLVSSPDQSRSYWLLEGFKRVQRRAKDRYTVEVRVSVTEEAWRTRLTGQREAQAKQANAAAKALRVRARSVKQWWERPEDYVDLIPAAAALVINRDAAISDQSFQRALSAMIRAKDSCDRGDAA